ncbi:MAG: hypothetical protein LKI88_02295 [Bifidobacterium sp.]|jgi:signal transduction histidine kinase|nr:hypothetical protein [Bifidobacterium sp.]MCI1864755.1 hypothetical protein [Bifidobacterium sp.]
MKHTTPIDPASTARDAAIYLRTVLRHPSISLIGAAIGIITVFESFYWLFTGPFSTLGVVFLLIRFAAIALFIINPPLGAYAVVASQCLDFVIPTVSPVSMLFVCLVAVASLSYLHLAQGCVLGFVLAASAFISSWLYPVSFMRSGGAVSFACVVALAIAAGTLVRMDARHKFQDAQNRSLKHHADAARRLHDYTTNDLSNIIMIADRELHSDERHDAAPTLDTILETATDALAQTRQAIVTLEGGTDHDGDDATPHGARADVETFERDLFQLIDDQQELLETLGFQGTVMVPNHATDHLSVAERKFILGSMREIFGNISRYAQPDNGYTIMVSLTNEAYDLNVCDTPLAESQEQAGAGVIKGLGSGMSRYRQEAEAVHGVWRVESSPATWSLVAHVPRNDPRKA